MTNSIGKKFMLNIDEKSIFSNIFKLNTGIDIKLRGSSITPKITDKSVVKIIEKTKAHLTPFFVSVTIKMKFNKARSKGIEDTFPN